MSGRYDVIVVGAGLAGLTAALDCAPRRVLLLGGGAPERASSFHAQGGIAAAVGDDDDPTLHETDTLVAGAGLCDPAIVRLVTREAPAAVARLALRGLSFDITRDGRPALGREAAHGRSRILHAGGDATGRAAVEALRHAVAMAVHIDQRPDAEIVGLWEDGGQVVGVIARQDDVLAPIAAPAVVLATGGIGQLYAETTNPVGANGRGLAAAARAGAALRHLEFVQFHPTAIAGRGDPLPLATEALRGAGAILIDGQDRRIMDGVHVDRELAPRDVVARAIHRERRQGNMVYLDARTAVGDTFPTRFPTVWSLAQAQGIDPRVQPIPVAPAAHYHMGGLAVDDHGRTNLPGLWACGEVACTGLHGANRLASNSLLEALVFGTRVGADIVATPLAPARPRRAPTLPTDAPADPALRARLRRTMSDLVGVERDTQGLDAALAAIEQLSQGTHGLLADQCLIAGEIALAALARRDSRGSHCRTDALRQQSQEQDRKTA